jgi:chromosome partitioning protein
MFVSGTQPRSGRSSSTAHVIAVGNEKGGSGKSTTAMHLAVALLKSGYSVATVDLDGRQLSLTRYVENRKRWARASRIHCRFRIIFTCLRRDGRHYRRRERRISCN